MVQAVIASFVIRFTQEHENESENHAWRGYIRHVQSKIKLVNVTHFQESLGNMLHVVELDDTQGDLIRNIY